MSLVRRRKADPARVDPDRRALVELCLYARDRAGSPAVAERIEAGLDAVGVQALRPDGELFDPQRHEAAAAVPTENADRHDTVAETELPGFADRGELIRPAVVSVYRLRASDEEPAG